MQTGRMRKGGMVGTVLKYLQAGHELSQYDAAELWNEYNLRNKISVLRADGYNIASREEHSKKGGIYKVYFLSSEQHCDPMRSTAYWMKFFSGMGDKMSRECGEAMYNIYVETGKEYKEIWPEPGTSVFKPIFERNGFVWEAPKKESA